LDSSPKIVHNYLQTTNEYSISRRSYLPAGAPTEAGGQNGFPLTSGNLPNQFAFVSTKNIDWTFINPTLSGTTGYIPMYWYNPAVTSTDPAALDITDDQSGSGVQSTHINLTALNTILISDYPSESDPTVDFTVTVDPKPSGSDQNIQIRVSMATEGATLFFSVFPQQVTLTSANNFTSIATATAANRFLSNIDLSPESVEGSIIFNTTVTDTSHPAFDTYNGLNRNVGVTITLLGERINRVAEQDLPPENVAFESNGYYPLYNTETAATNASSLSGNYPAESLQIKASSDLGDYIYYMPVGVPNYFGNYVPPTPPNNNNDILNNNNNNDILNNNNITPIIQP
jgi:hypothetical protein